MYKFQELDEGYFKEMGYVFKNVNDPLYAVRKFFEKYKNEPELAKLDQHLFMKSKNNFISLTGDNVPNKNVLVFPKLIIEGENNLSDIEVIEIVERFINLYDVNNEQYSQTILPLLILYICLRSRHLICLTGISFINGYFRISFTSNQCFLKNQIINILKESLEFKFFEYIKLINIEEIEKCVANTRLVDTTDGFWHTYSIPLLKNQDTCLVETRFLLSFGTALSRKEIGDILAKYSPRSINDALKQLIDNKEVEKIGNKFSPNTKYRYLMEERKFL